MANPNMIGGGRMTRGEMSGDKRSNKAGKLPAVKALGGEGLHQGAVGFLGDVVKMQALFAQGRLGIQSPMDEHAVAKALKGGNIGKGCGNHGVPPWFFRLRQL